MFLSFSFGKIVILIMRQTWLLIWKMNLDNLLWDSQWLYHESYQEHKFNFDHRYICWHHVAFPLWGLEKERACPPEHFKKKRATPRVSLPAIQPTSEAVWVSTNALGVLAKPSCRREGNEMWKWRVHIPPRHLLSWEVSGQDCDYSYYSRESQATKCSRGQKRMKCVVNLCPWEK